MSNRPHDAPPHTEQGVGIWKPSFRNGRLYYKRDLQMRGEWHLWADKPEIPPKGKRKRLVLLGESVARGFLYDPYYNVARELETVLAQAGDGRETEVVDLAKSSILIDNLRSLVKSCIRLEPDVVVIFAGNNWVFIANDIDYNYKDMYDEYVKGALEGVKTFREEELKKVIRDFFALLDATFLKNNIPVVFVIPEFNLKDWKSDEQERILPWAPDDRISRWLQNRSKATQALQRNDPDALGEAAQQMVEADPSNPYGHELLGRYHLYRGETEPARQAYERARDTIVFNRSQKSLPRCIKAIRETILQRSKELGIATVDLREVFRNAYPDRVPDRELFLDNCHLTVKGIKLAMKHTAHAVRQAFGVGAADPVVIVETGLIPDPSVQAMAHFCAAIYNAHYGQEYDIVHHHCHKALSFSPSIRDTMMRYIDFSSRRAATALCRSFEDLVSSGEMRQYEGGLSLMHPKFAKLLDILLVDAMAGNLKQFGASVDDQVKTLRISEHALTGRINLLESYYSKTSYHEFFLGSDQLYHEARSVESQFYFVSKGDRPLSIRMVYRTPHREHAGQYLTAWINDPGNILACLPMSKKWTSGCFSIDRHQLREGVNTLTIVWPYSSEPWRLEGQISHRSLLKATFPVLGNIHLLTVMPETDTSVSKPDTVHPWSSLNN